MPVYSTPRVHALTRLERQVEHGAGAALSLHLCCARSCLAHVMVMLGFVTTPCWLELTLLFLSLISWLSLFWL